MPFSDDHDRFQALLEMHKRLLYKVANVYCSENEDRRDLIQEIVIQLWRSFARFDTRFKFSTWMYRVAINTAISFQRNERRRPRGCIPFDELGIELAAADQTLADAGDDVRLLYQLIGGLDELSRALIVLALDGISHEAIAEIAGISTRNVTVRLHRIRQRLARELDVARRAEEKNL